jgi:hypothetical protein
MVLSCASIGSNALLDPYYRLLRRGVPVSV